MTAKIISLQEARNKPLACFLQADMVQDVAYFLKFPALAERFLGGEFNPGDSKYEREYLLNAAQREQARIRADFLYSSQALGDYIKKKLHIGDMITWSNKSLIDMGNISAIQKYTKAEYALIRYISDNARNRFAPGEDKPEGDGGQPNSRS